jgi:hypothetical protein
VRLRFTVYCHGESTCHNPRYSSYTGVSRPLLGCGGATGVWISLDPRDGR